MQLTPIEPALDPGSLVEQCHSDDLHALFSLYDDAFAQQRSDAADGARHRDVPGWPESEFSPNRVKEGRREGDLHGHFHGGDRRGGRYVAHPFHDTRMPPAKE